MTSFKSVGLFMLVLAPFLIPSDLAYADQYFNSAEPGCDGSDPTVVFCDDFEDGDWAFTDHDGMRGGAKVTPNAETYLPNDGWWMDPYYPTQNSFGKVFRPQPHLRLIMLCVVTSVWQRRTVPPHQARACTSKA